MLDDLYMDRLETTLRCTHALSGLSVAELVEHSVRLREGVLTREGAFCALTGQFTGRSPKDKYIGRATYSANRVHWAPVNQPMDPQHFARLYDRVLRYIENASRPTFVGVGFVRAGSTHLPIRVVTERAWHNLFAKQLFLRPDETDNPEDKGPAGLAEFTILDFPSVKSIPRTDGTRSETCIAVSFEQRIILITGTEYAGEIKKSVFSVANGLYPELGLLPMHCSANESRDGQRSALFFGLSGTGKTTLSADPQRRLVGDDEHTWGADGVANIEGGCYAKCIHLTREHEPQIWDAIRFGTILENVDVDPHTRRSDYDSSKWTENTRAAYPVEFIAEAKPSGRTGHPQAVLFLTADATGVLPPIARLTREQAMYHFLSGYTSKLAGTERGVTEPEPTFSSCFGAPFLPLHPMTYAQLLGERLTEHDAVVYWVNTGWSGGAYGVGQRMQLAMTRRLVEAATSGELTEAEWDVEPVFGLAIPRSVTGVKTSLLNPANAWEDEEAYAHAARTLARQFRLNAERFRDHPEAAAVIATGGPLWE